MASSFSIDDILNLDGGHSTRKNSELLQTTDTKTTASKHLPVARDMNTAASRKRKREGDSTGNCSESPSSDSGEENTPLPSSKREKRSRTAYSTVQLRALECAFRVCPYPDSYTREMVAKTTGISEAKIQIWFQNRRARFRKREKPIEQPTRSHPRPILPRPSPDSSHFLPPTHMYPPSYLPHYPPFSPAFSHTPFYPAHFNYHQPPVKFTGAQSRSRTHQN